MRHLRITHLARHAFEGIRHANIEHPDAPARAADHMMMVVPRVIEFIAIGAVTKVASLHDLDLLHGRESAINRDEIAFTGGQILVDFFCRKRSVLLGENRQDGFARRGNAMPMRTQRFEGMLESFAGDFVGMRHRLWLNDTAPMRNTGPLRLALVERNRKLLLLLLLSPLF